MPHDERSFTDPALADIAGAEEVAPPPTVKQYLRANPGVRNLLKIQSKRERTLAAIRQATGNMRVTYGSVMTTLSEVSPVRPARFARVDHARPRNEAEASENRRSTGAAAHAPLLSEPAASAQRRVDDRSPGSPAHPAPPKVELEEYS